MIALMPSNAEPFAAQSRELPEPYSLPAMTTSGVPSLLVSKCGIVNAHLARRSERAMVHGPSTPGVIRLRRRMLPNVPRIMTS